MNDKLRRGRWRSLLFSTLGLTFAAISPVGCGNSDRSAGKDALTSNPNESMPAIDGGPADSDKGEASDDHGEGSHDSSGPVVQVQSDKPRDMAAAIAPDDYQTVVSGTNAFGFDIFKKAAHTDENVIFSPTSVTVALGMVYAGTAGNTAVQMSQVLHNTLTAESFHTAMNRLTLDLASREVAEHGTGTDKKSVRLSLVDTLWGQVGYEFHQTFIDLLGVRYGAGVELVDFANAPEVARSTINAAIAAQTEQRIQELIPPHAVDNAPLVLTNTVYFKASWSQAFNKLSTYDAPFHTLAGADKVVATMHARRSIPYEEGADYQMVALDYDGGKLTMDIVLPASGHFADVESQLTADWFAQTTAKLAEDDVALALPKLHFLWGTKSLRDGLVALGMTDAFEPKANFTGISSNQPLFISDVLHKAFIDVDEEGTEAAAATAVVFDGGAGPPPAPNKEFVVDRPFFFFIRDAGGAVLFIGQVVDPQAN